jgi:hypothetical protein
MLKKKSDSAALAECAQFLLLAQIGEKLLGDANLRAAGLARPGLSGHCHDLGVALGAGNNFRTGLPGHRLSPFGCLMSVNVG